MPKKCKNCNNIILRKSQKFCCFNCYCISITGVKRPKIIGEKVSKTKRDKKQKLGYINSPETREKMRKSKLLNPLRVWLGKSGEAHPAYKKNRISLKSVDDRRNMKYSDWRMSVWMRDKFTCKMLNNDCVRRIEAHHILPWKDYPELRYDIHNGITLCKFHHPKKAKDVEMLSPFLKELINNSNA